jgi:hypothetical protein
MKRKGEPGWYTDIADAMRRAPKHVTYVLVATDGSDLNKVLFRGQQRDAISALRSVLRDFEERTPAARERADVEWENALADHDHDDGRVS